MSTVGVNEGGFGSDRCNYPQMLGHAAFPHPEKQHIAVFGARDFERDQVSPGRFPQSLLVLWLGPIRSVRWRRLGFAPVRFRAPDPAQEPEAIGPRTPGGGLVAVRCPYPAARG